MSGGRLVCVICSCVNLLQLGWTRRLEFIAKDEKWTGIWTIQLTNIESNFTKFLQKWKREKRRLLILGTFRVQITSVYFMGLKNKNNQARLSCVHTCYVHVHSVNEWTHSAQNFVIFSRKFSGPYVDRVHIGRQWRTSSILIFPWTLFNDTVHSLYRQHKAVFSNRPLQLFMPATWYFGPTCFCHLFVALLKG